MIPNLPPLPTKHPISLEILRKLFSELETTFATTNIMKERADNSNTVDTDYIVELSKCVGYLTSIVQEATLLLGDFKREATEASTPGAADHKKGVETVLKALGLDPNDTGGYGDLALLPTIKKPRGPAQN